MPPNQQQQQQIPKGTKTIITLGLKTSQHVLQVHSQSDKSSVRSVIKASYDDPSAMILELVGITMIGIGQPGQEEVKIVEEAITCPWENVGWWQTVEVPEPSLIKVADMLPPPDLKIQ